LTSPRQSWREIDYKTRFQDHAVSSHRLQIALSCCASAHSNLNTSSLARWHALCKKGERWSFQNLIMKRRIINNELVGMRGELLLWRRFGNGRNRASGRNYGCSPSRDACPTALHRTKGRYLYSSYSAGRAHPASYKCAARFRSAPTALVSHA